MQEAIAELGYLPNRAARNLRTRSSHLIGLPIKAVEEGTANAQMDRFVHSLVEASSAAGYHVLLFTGTDTGDPQDELPGYDDLLRSTAVDAFVVTDTYLGNPQADWLNERRAPFVAFGRPWNDPEARHPWVDVDGAAGTELATTHLIDKGHERIAWIGWRKESLLGEDRRSGWSRALRTRGLSTTGSRVPRRGHRRVGPRGQRGAARRGAPLRVRLRLRHPGHGGAAHPAPSAACAPVTDIAVTGFDDSQVAQVVPPGLTPQVRQPLEDVAVEVVKALAGLLGPPTDRDTRGVLLDADPGGARGSRLASSGDVPPPTWAAAALRVSVPRHAEQARLVVTRLSASSGRDPPRLKSVGLGPGKRPVRTNPGAARWWRRVVGAAFAAAPHDRGHCRARLGGDASSQPRHLALRPSTSRFPRQPSVPRRRHRRSRAPCRATT